MEDEQLEQMWKEAWREYEALSGHDFLDLPRSVDAATLVQTLERQIQSRENWDQVHVRTFFAAPSMLCCQLTVSVRTTYGNHSKLRETGQYQLWDSLRL